MNVAERTLYESVLDTFEAINQKNPVPHSTETSQTMNALNPFCTQKKTTINTICIFARSHSPHVFFDLMECLIGPLPKSVVYLTAVQIK